MRRIGMWGLALVAGWVMNAKLGWSADTPMTSVVLGKLHHSNVKEISMARLAQRSARSRQVKDFADAVIDDDTAADKRVVSLARQQGVDLDATTAPPNAADLESLKSAVDFDASFAQVMHDDQEGALSEMSAAFDGTQDEKLHILLGELLPAMRAHRDMAKMILHENPPRASL